MVKDKKYIGFTLIEMLVVISIIGILAALAIFGMQSAFKNSRNTQRKSDLKQYQSALENWANTKNGLYPSRTAAAGAQASSSSALCGDLGMTNCPEDPTYSAGVWPFYRFQTDGGGLGGACTQCGSKYILWARLEDSSEKYWVVCSNGKSGEYSGAISTTNGTCVLP
jgi:prepilin-type N-terminal cleavage/methylation domain-containing protein